jgi:hypothetical protein
METVMDKIALIGRDLALAPPGAKMSLFIERCATIGGAIGLSPEMVGRKLWDVATAHKLTGAPGSGTEELVEFAIENAVARVDEADQPRATNGHDAPSSPSMIPGGQQIRNDTPRNADGKKPPYKLTLARDITAEATLKVFLIDGFLGRDEVSFWYGQPECGKSTVLIDAVCHVATGRPWCGRAVMRGAVLYVAAERGQNVKRRILAWRLEHGINDFPLAVIDDAVDLRSGKVDTDRIIAAAKALEKSSGQKVVWIIFDTLSRVLAGGDENSSKDMGLLVLSVDRIFRETGAHCSLVHHMPLGNSDRMRGHGLANGAGDTTVHVEKQNGIVTAAVDKGSDLPEDEKPRLSFRFKSVTLIEDPHRTASVMVQAEDQAAAGKAGSGRLGTTAKTRGETKVVRTFRDAFAEAIDTDGNTIQVRGDGPKVRAVDVQKVRAEFERRYVTGEADAKKRAAASSKAFRRTMRELPPQFATETRETGELIWKVDD